MKKTNIYLINYCENALKEKWYYGWGAHGEKATVEFVDKLVNKYPSMNTEWKSYMLKAVEAKSNLCDCYGLVKGFLFTNEDNAMVYNPAMDFNTQGAYNKSTEKGLLNSMPEIPGLILYMPGHVGVYIGKGRFIECAGGVVGMTEGKIIDGKVVKGSRFTNWFKDFNIIYLNNEEQKIEKINNNEEQKVEKINNNLKNIISSKKLQVSFDGKDFAIDDILKDGYNYVNLRAFAEILGYDVSYDMVNKMPILKSKKIKI